MTTSSKENSEPVQAIVDQEASDETVGYVPKGYSFIKEEFLICPACDKRLVSLVLVKEVPGTPETIFRAKCPKCKINSFSKKISGYKVIYQGVPPFTIDDLDTYDNKCEFKIK